MSSKPSLVERAAEIYDFQSGLRVASPPADLPPPRVRAVPQPAAVVREREREPEPEPAPAQAPVRAAPEPVAPPPEPVRPVVAKAPDRRPVPHQQVVINQEALQRAGYILPDAPSSSLGEELRLVKRRLLARIDAQAERGASDSRMALVASAQPGDGKTFVAINLALSIAGEAERQVLLVDGDTGKSDLPGRLGFEAEAGLVDALADPGLDPEALVIDTDIAGLSVLPAGRKARNVPELLASTRTGEVFERLLAADPRRIILIDSPPALAASPAAVLAGLVGQALVVVRADVTSEADLRETIDLLSSCPHLALVLNGAALSIGGRRFGRYEEYR